MKSSIFIHMKNIQSLVIEMIRDNRNTQKGNSWYNSRQISKFSRLLVKSVYHGNESVSFLGPKVWDILPDDCKDVDYLNTFKNKVKMEN